LEVKGDLMEKTKYYNFHGIFKIACSGDVDYFSKYFKVDKIDKKDLDIIIQMGDFDFDKTGCKRLGKYWGKDKILYLEYKIHGVYKQKILISDLFGQARLRFVRRTHKIFSVAHFMELMMTIKLLQKGYTFVHSAAVAKGNKSYLITAWSEMGKSSTIFGLSKIHEFGLMGDDSVILSKDGIIYSYPLPAGVFFHSENVKNLKFSPAQKIKLMIKYLVAKLPPLYLYINPNLQIELSNIGRIVDKAKLEKTYFLAWGSGRKELSKDVAIKKIFSSTLHGHNQYFAKNAFFAYCYFNNFDPNFIEMNMKKVLQSGLGECILLRSKKKEFHKLIEIESNFKR